MYKFKLIKNKNGFRVQFAFRNEAIFWTENYAKKASALNAIKAVKEKSALAQMEEIDETIKKAPAKKTAKKTLKK